jgi:hypothetical protein
MSKEDFRIFNAQGHVVAAMCGYAGPALCSAAPAGRTRCGAACPLAQRPLAQRPAHAPPPRRWHYGKNPYEAFDPLGQSHFVQSQESYL